MTDNVPVLPSTPAPRTRSAAATMFSWMRDLMFSVVIAIVVIIFIYQPVKVEGTSMMPSLVDQERIFVNKFIYRFGIGEISRGDMVVFWFPEDRSKSYIKRVIGLPGDTIGFEDGTVVLNGKSLHEEYVPDQYRDRYSKSAEVIPPDMYFVLGDHRNSSNDSRSWGFVPKQNIYGKAVFVYWPLERLGPVH